MECNSQVINIDVLIVLVHKFLILRERGNCLCYEFIVCSVLQEFIYINVNFWFNVVVQFLSGNVQDRICNVKLVILFILL